MSHPILDTVSQTMATLYEDMDQAYVQAADAMGLSCAGCTDNCCQSYFQHHTHAEWLYFWEGFSRLPGAERARYHERATSYVVKSRDALGSGKVPRELCPVIDEKTGRCGMYEHRLMICRLHGVPNMLLTPRGRRDFPGCFRSQAIASLGEEHPPMDRTPFYRQLAEVESSILRAAGGQLGKVDLTLAQIILAGEPPALNILRKLATGGASN